MKIVDAVTMAEMLRFGMVAELDVTEMGEREREFKSIVWTCVECLCISFKQLKFLRCQTQANVRSENENYTAMSVSSVDQ